MSICDQLSAFADGELSEEAGQSFQDHLAGCDSCIEGLGEIWMLDARVARLPKQRRAAGDSGQFAFVAALLLVLFLFAVVGMLLAMRGDFALPVTSDRLDHPVSAPVPADRLSRGRP